MSTKSLESCVVLFFLWVFFFYVVDACFFIFVTLSLFLFMFIYLLGLIDQIFLVVAKWRSATLFYLLFFVALQSHMQNVQDFTFFLFSMLHVQDLVFKLTMVSSTLISFCEKKHTMHLSERLVIGKNVQIFISSYFTPPFIIPPFINGFGPQVFF